MRMVLVGGGGHALDVLDAIEVTIGHDVVVGIVDDRPELGDRFRGRVPHLGPVGTVTQVDATHYVLAVGWPRARAELAAQMPPALCAASIVHPMADVSERCTVGEGSVVLSFARISPHASVDAHCYIGYQSAVGHESVVGRFSSVMPGAKISGECVIGERAMIGSNAVIREGVTIGDGVIVGAGAVVLDDVPDGSTVLGVPARPADDRS